MYGIDETTNLEFLVGQELCQVCIGQFQLILNFTGGASISVESSVEHIHGSVAHIWAIEGEKQVHSLIGSLGIAIESIRIVDGNCLELRLSDESVLRILDSNDEAESFLIQGGDQEIVV